LSYPVHLNFVVSGVVNNEPKNKGNAYKEGSVNYAFFLKYDTVPNLATLPNGETSSTSSIYLTHSVPAAWGNAGPIVKGNRITVIGSQDSNAKEIGDKITSVYNNSNRAYESTPSVVINHAHGAGVIDSKKVHPSYIVYSIREKKQGNTQSFRMYYLLVPTPQLDFPEGTGVFWTGHVLSNMFKMPEGTPPFAVGANAMMYARTIIPLDFPRK